MNLFRIQKKLSKRLILSLLVLLICAINAGRVSATEYSASFKNADINEFINIVGKNLNKTIILDPSVRGSINVRSYDLLNERQYYQFFLNVLEVYGFATVEMENGIVKVVKAKDAKTSAIPVVDDGETYAGDQMVTRVVPVTNVSVRELAPLLRQLNDNAGGGNVVHYDPSNVLMITGRAAVVNRLVEIVHRVDKAGDQEVDIIKLKYASALEMVKIVDAIQGSSSGAKNIRSSVLSPKLVADERTNSVIISGEPKSRARIVKLIKSLDAELLNEGNTHVFYLKYANAQEVVDVLKGVSQSIDSPQGGTAGNSSADQSDLSIEAHEGTNAIVVSAQPALMSSLTSIIRQLDIRRAQVLVEAIIVEISEKDGISLGVQWGTANGGTQFQDSAVTTGDIIAGTQNDDAAISAIAKISGGIAGYIGSDWGAVLQTLSTATSSNILATPSITTLDNQEASFIVGDEVPVLTGSTSSATNDNPFQTIERKEIGIKLKVTPQINAGNSVQLVIEQEVSNINNDTSAVDVIFSTRSVKTTVLAKSGETIVIGGLIDEDVNETVQKVPLLGDIPVLGFLFRSTNSTTVKRNLMVFLRASIIRDDETMMELSTRKYSLIRAIQENQRDGGINLMPNAVAPVLPEWGKSHEVNPDSFIGSKGQTRQPTTEGVN
jgi:general secretion pathway protein D